MDCPHGTPGGARYCALCRRQVLVEAGQVPRHPWRSHTPGAKPMPDWFRDRVSAEATRAGTTQPTLDLEDS